MVRSSKAPLCQIELHQGFPDIWIYHARHPEVAPVHPGENSNLQASNQEAPLFRSSKTTSKDAVLKVRPSWMHKPSWVKMCCNGSSWTSEASNCSAY